MATNKQSDLRIAFNRLYVKFSIGKKKSKKSTTLLDLIRDEIILVVLINLTKQLEKLLIIISESKFNSEEKLDILFKLLIISSKKRIFKKLNLISDPLERGTKSRAYRCVLNFLEPEDYELFIVLVQFVLNEKPNAIYTNRVFLRILLEHLILRISTLLIYDVFLVKKMSRPILETYITDLLLFSSYKNKLQIYLVWQRYRKSIGFNNNSAQFLALTKDGPTIKTAIVEKGYLKTTETLYGSLLARALRLFDNIVGYVIYLLSTK